MKEIQLAQRGALMDQPVATAVEDSTAKPRGRSGGAKTTFRTLKTMTLIAGFLIVGPALMITNKEILSSTGRVSFPCVLRCRAPPEPPWPSPARNMLPTRGTLGPCSSCVTSIIVVNHRVTRENRMTSAPVRFLLLASCPQRYPMLLSSLGLVTSALVTHIAALLGFVRPRQRETMTRAFFLRNIAPVGACHALTLAAGNAQ